MEEAGGRSKGCGLVEYAQVEEAQRAISTLNDTELKGRTIFVREDREASGNVSGPVAGRRLYIGNLSYECAWYDLKVGGSLPHYSPQIPKEHTSPHIFHFLTQ